MVFAGEGPKDNSCQGIRVLTAGEEQDPPQRGWPKGMEARTLRATLVGRGQVPQLCKVLHFSILIVPHLLQAFGSNNAVTHKITIGTLSREEHVHWTVPNGQP